MIKIIHEFTQIYPLFVKISENSWINLSRLNSYFQKKNNGAFNAESFGGGKTRTMKQYLILLKGKKDLDYSPSELQKRLEEYRQWVATIEDHYVLDNRLEANGAYISQKDNIKTDGPFLEAKEIIAGFIILKAESLEEAIELSNTSPLLNYFELYVRPIVLVA